MDSISIKIILLLLLLSSINGFSQQQKQRVDTYQLALKAELERHLYPQVNAKTTKELAVFLVLPHVGNNSSLRLIERNGKGYIEIRYLHRNVGTEVLTAFISNKYSELSIPSDSFIVEVSECFKIKVLSAFRETVNQKITIDSDHNIIETYDGTNYNFWLNENDKTKSISIRDDGDTRYYGWKFAKINLQIIDDIKNGVFDESKYKM